MTVPYLKSLDDLGKYEIQFASTDIERISTKILPMLASLLENQTFRDIRDLRICRLMVNLASRNLKETHILKVWRNGFRHPQTFNTYLKSKPLAE